MSDHAITDSKKLLRMFDFALEKWLTRMKDPDEKISTSEIERLIKLARDMVKEIHSVQKGLHDQAIAELSDDQVEAEIARLLETDKTAETEIARLSEGPTPPQSPQPN